MSRTILVADDHPLFREALRWAVARTLPDARLCEASDTHSLYGLVDAEPDADLLLLDLAQPNLTPTEINAAGGNLLWNLVFAADARNVAETVVRDNQAAVKKAAAATTVAAK